jgi:uncharacterized membrane protein HdeD (DUF308 family)
MTDAPSNHDWLDTVERGIASLPDLAGEGVRRRLTALVKHSIRSHQTSDTVRGALAIVTGIAAIVFPDLSLTALLVVFAIYAALDAALAIATAVTSRTNRLLLGAQATVDVAVITAVIAYPEATRSVALTLLAVWVVIMGALRVRDAMDFRQGLHVNVPLVALAVLAIVAGVQGMTAPTDNITVVTLNVWIFTIIRGAMLLAHRHDSEPAPEAATEPASALVHTRSQA